MRKRSTADFVVEIRDQTKALFDAAFIMEDGHGVLEVRLPPGVDPNRLALMLVLAAAATASAPDLALMLLDMRDSIAEWFDLPKTKEQDVETPSHNIPF